MEASTAGVELTIQPPPPPAGFAVHPVPTTAYRSLKRVVDVVLSMVALIVSLPGFVLIALVVRCTSRGPVLFRQFRVGRDGRPFTVFKFRSMCQDAEARLHDPN